jgi:hypothetical protein
VAPAHCDVIDPGELGAGLGQLAVEVFHD